MKYKCGAIGNNLVNIRGNFFSKPLGTLGEYMGNHMEQIGNIDNLWVHFDTLVWPKCKVWPKLVYKFACCKDLFTIFTQVFR